MSTQFVGNRCLSRRHDFGSCIVHRRLQQDDPSMPEGPTPDAAVRLQSDDKIEMVRPMSVREKTFLCAEGGLECGSSSYRFPCSPCIA